MMIYIYAYTHIYTHTAYPDLETLSIFSEPLSAALAARCAPYI